MDRNGIRAAIVPSQLPQVLQRILTDKPIDTSEFEAWQKQFIAPGVNDTIPRKILHERLHIGQGQEHRIPVSDSWSAASWTVETETGSSVGQGEMFRAFYKLVAFSSGDGSMKLSVVPEIHHGQSRPTIGVEDHSFLFKTEQTIQSIEELRLSARLRPGETLVIGAGSQINNLGSLLFGPGESGGFRQRMLLIRLIQSPSDILFRSGRANSTD
jgi:hypothetical protein